MLTDSLEMERLLCVINELNWGIPFDGMRSDSCIVFGLMDGR